MKEIIKFCHRNSLLLLADEVLIINTFSFHLSSSLFRSIRRMFILKAGILAHLGKCCLRWEKIMKTFS